MRSKLVAAAGIAGLLAMAPAATAAVKSGAYKGATDRHEPVALNVTKKRKLTGFSFRRLKLPCSDGDVLRLGKVDSGARKLWLTGSGKFDFTFTYDAGDTWRARGRVHGSKATGTLRFKVRFDSSGEPDPHGDVLCDSGKRRFSAKLH